MSEFKKQENSEQESVDFEFKILNDPEQRELLMEKVNELMGKIESGEYTNVVFLDKSARPLSTLCLDLWHKKYPGKKFPKINFINIGREISDELSKKLGKKKIGEALRTEIDDRADWIRDIPPETVMETVGEGEGERLKNTYKYLADAPKENKLLVVEELSLTGGSAVLAEKILKITFPKLNIETYALTDNSGKLFLNEALLDYKNPPWRKNSGDRQYGITGVVDDKEHPLTAKPVREQSLGERLTAVDVRIAKAFEHLYKSWEDAVGSLKETDKIKAVKDFKIFQGDITAYALEDKENAMAANIATEYVKNIILPIAEKAEPYIEELKSFGTMTDDNREEIFQLIKKIEPIDVEMQLISVKMHQAENVLFEREAGITFDQIIKKHNVPEGHKDHIIKVSGNIIFSKIFGRYVGPKHFLGPLSWILKEMDNIQKLNKLKDLIGRTDYSILVAQLRDELHHTVNEYCEKHGI